MIIELSQLPPIIQQYVLDKETKTVQIVNNGQVIRDIDFGSLNSQADDEYYPDFDLDRMKRAVESPTITVPNGLAKDKAAFRAWIKANAG